MSPAFDLRQLRYFVAVAETLSFRRAAERLFISQPPLSRQIRALEESLGVALFERNTSMVKLTREGEAALGMARRLLADAESLGDAMRRLAQQRARVARIGVTVAVATADCRRLAAAWKKALGPIEVEAAETTALLGRLERGRLDFALVGAIEPPEGFAHEVVHTVPLVAVLPRSHPAARKRTVRLQDLAATPFFWLPRSYNPAYHDHCAAVLRRKRFAPRLIPVAPGQLVTLQRIADGEGCTLMSRSQVPTLTKGIVHRPLEEGALLGIRITALWRPDRTAGAAFAKTARAILAKG